MTDIVIDTSDRWFLVEMDASTTMICASLFRAIQQCNMPWNDNEKDTPPRQTLSTVSFSQ